MSKIQSLVNFEKLKNEGNQKYRESKNKTISVEDQKGLLLEAIGSYNACKKIELADIDRFKIHLNLGMAYRMLVIKENGLNGPDTFGSLLQAMIIQKDKTLQFFRRSLRNFSKALKLARNLEMKEKITKTNANIDELLKIIEQQFSGIQSNKQRLFEMICFSFKYYCNFTLESQTRILQIETDYHRIQLDYARQINDFSLLVPSVEQLIKSPHHENLAHLDAKTEFSKVYEEFNRLVSIFSTVSDFFEAKKQLEECKTMGQNVQEVKLILALDNMQKLSNIHFKELEILKAEANFKVGIVYLNQFDNEEAAKEYLRSCVEIGDGHEGIEEQVWFQEASNRLNEILESQKQFEEEESEFEMLLTNEEKSILQKLEDLRLEYEDDGEIDQSSLISIIKCKLNSNLNLDFDEEEDISIVLMKLSKRFSQMGDSEIKSSDLYVLKKMKQTICDIHNSCRSRVKK